MDAEWACVCTWSAWALFIGRASVLLENSIQGAGETVQMYSRDECKIHTHFFKYITLFYLFIFDCVGSSLLCTGFL